VNKIFKFLALAILPLALVSETVAHNNPTFREDLLVTIDVHGEPADDGSFSEAFSLEWPKKTVQLVWYVAGGDAEKIRFSVSQNAKEMLADVAHGDRTTRLTGSGLTISAVSGANGPFQLAVHARVLDRSIKKD